MKSPTMHNKRAFFSRITWPAKMALIALIGIMAALGVQFASGPTEVMTAQGSAIASSIGSDQSVAQAAPQGGSSEDSVDPTTGIIETKTVALKACPVSDESFNQLPTNLQNTVETCSPEQQALWDQLVALGGGTPRSEQVKLANTGSLLEATSYLPVSTWSTEIGTFSSAPDLKGFEWASMISNLIAFIAGWIVAMVGYLWMIIMFVVAFAFSADIATRGIHFIDFMTAWVSSLLTSSTGAMIGIVPIIFLAALSVQMIALIFPGKGGKLLGTRSGNMAAGTAIREVIVSIAISLGAFCAFVFMGAQAQKNHDLTSQGIVQNISSTEKSAIGKLATQENQAKAVAEDIGSNAGVKAVEVQNVLTADIPVSAIKEPENWATFSPGWILGNLFKVINWGTAKIVEIPLTLSQATNQSSITGNDVNSCNIYIDGKRGLFLATPAAGTYELASNLMVSMDIMFQRLVLDPYSQAAFGGGGSGSSAYCRVLESASGTSTGEQVLAMRASGLYGAIVGTGGMGTIGGEGSADIVAPGNPWKHVSVETTGGTLVDATGNPAMLTTYDQYAVSDADSGDSTDSKSAVEKLGSVISGSVGAVTSAAGSLVDLTMNPTGAVTDLVKDQAGNLVESLGTEETIDDPSSQDSSIPGSVEIGGGSLDYSASMTALQRVFGPGIVNTDGQFESLAYFAACRPVVGTKTMNLAGAWVGAEQAEPAEGAGELTAENCLSDSIIGPYSNGGFGGGSEDKENAVAGGADQKAWLYKPRDSDNKRTNLFGFTIGDDLNDKSSIAKLGKARGNIMRSNEAVEFYQATSGNLTWKVFITVAVIVTGVWVVYKYIVKMLVGALFAGFLLIGAGIAFIFALAALIFPAAPMRNFFRTSAMSVLSSAAASAFVSIILVTIVAMSRVFEFMLLGAIGYVLGGNNSLFILLEPLIVLLTIIGAAIIVEKGAKKLFGGPSIASWATVGAISGMAAQPIRNLTDPGNEPLFNGYNGKPILEEGKNPFKKEDKEVLGDDDVVSEGSGLGQMARNFMDGRRDDEAGVDENGNPINPDEDTVTGDSNEVNEARVNSANETVSLIKDEEQQKRGENAPTADEQRTMAEGLTGNPEYDSTGVLDEAANQTMDASAMLSGAGADMSVMDMANNDSNSVNNMAQNATPEQFSRLDLGNGGWSNSAPQFDTTAANDLYAEALENMRTRMQGGMDDMALSAATAMEQQTETLGRMAGSVSITPESTQALDQAVQQYSDSARRLTQDLTIQTSNGITGSLSAETVNSIIENTRSGFAEMQTMMTNQVVSATGPAMAQFQEQLAQSVSQETARAIESSIPGLTAAVSRPIAASVTAAITSQISRNLRSQG